MNAGQLRYPISIFRLDKVRNDDGGVGDPSLILILNSFASVVQTNNNQSESFGQISNDLTFTVTMRYPSSDQIKVGYLILYRNKYLLINNWQQFENEIGLFQQMTCTVYDDVNVEQWQ